MSIDPHILNLYEAYDLKVDDLVRIAWAALNGDLSSPVEKVDGQNLTFTVNGSGHVRFIGKGCPAWTVDVGGISISDTFKHFADKPIVAHTFKESMEAIQGIVDANPVPFVKACLGGRRSINAEVTTPDNTNVIKYSDKTVCLHGLLPDDSRAFADLCKLLPIVTKDGWRLFPPPVVEFTQRDDAVARVMDINSRVNDLERKYSVLCNFTTIGDLCRKMISDKLQKECSSFLQPSLIHPAAERLLLEEASHLGKKDFRSPSSWVKFKQIDDDRVNFVGSALAPLENLSQLIGLYALESYNFKVADGSYDAAKEHRDFVVNVRKAFREGRVKASPAVLERIRTSLSRVDESMFTRNVEGIVFVRDGRRLKLTGAFAPINRLKGYFSYGKEPARII